MSTEIDLETQNALIEEEEEEEEEQQEVVETLTTLDCCNNPLLTDLPEPLDSKTDLLEHKVQIQSFTLPDSLKINKNSQYEALWNLKPTERENLLIFGKLIKTPRYVRQYLRDYKFSNVVHKGYSLDSNNEGENYILELLKYVNYISGKTYNGILVNWYTDGNEYIGYHSDDESKLVSNSDIYSITFGATRDFYLKNNETGVVHTYPLNHNNVLIMKSPCQQYYKHSVPKRLKCKESRINITFRLYKN
jgi:alkylated DNA repair dioxygenase AlkB